MTVFFTSGTTGSPKMAEHSHSSLGLGFALCGRYGTRPDSVSEALKHERILQDVTTTGSYCIGHVIAMESVTGLYP